MNWPTEMQALFTIASFKAVRFGSTSWIGINLIDSTVRIISNTTLCTHIFECNIHLFVFVFTNDKNICVWMNYWTGGQATLWRAGNSALTRTTIQLKWQFQWSKNRIQSLFQSFCTQTIIDMLIVFS